MTPGSPEAIHIDNTAFTDWTVVAIPTPKIRGCLPHLSAALARRHIDIDHVRIDRYRETGYVLLCLRQRHHGKITAPKAQWDLQLLVEAVLRFAPWLSVVPDPNMALQHFEQFVEHLGHDTLQPEKCSWLWEPSTLHALAVVLGSSQFLWNDFLRRVPALHLPVLTHGEIIAQRPSKHTLAERLSQALHAAASAEAGRHALNTFKLVFRTLH